MSHRVPPPLSDLSGMNCGNEPVSTLGVKCKSPGEKRRWSWVVGNNGAVYSLVKI